MKPIVTLSLNPAIDGAAEAETVRPIHKVRTWSERYDPGGGGINAARVVQELGGAASAIYLSGGTTGPVLDGLVRSSGIESVRILVANHTRISHTVHDRSSGLEFRFVKSGAAKIVALTLGRDGALLATRSGLRRLAGVKVIAKSAVGAGDSFLAAMTLGLGQGRDPEDALALAVAAGTAAVLTMGTEICRREDVERIYQEIKSTLATSTT